jgi:hypothetical protein
MKTRKEEILAYCLEEIHSGRKTIQECLAMYPDIREEIEPLLYLALKIQPEIRNAPAEFKQKTRENLIRIMKSEVVQEKWGWNLKSFLKPAFSFSSAVLILPLVAVIAMGGTSYASLNSLPDDALFPLKTKIENIQVALTFNNVSQANLHMKLAQRRVDEVVEQSRLNRKINSNLSPAFATQINNALQDIKDSSISNNSELLNKLTSSSLTQQTQLDSLLKLVPESEKPGIEQTLSVTRRSAIIAEVASTNPEYLSENPSVLDEDVEDSYFKVTGYVYKNDGQNLNIGGVDINKIFPFEGSLYLATNVEVNGLVKRDGTFISKIINIDQQSDVFKLEGIFNGTSQDGLFWDVGGLSVIAPLNVVSPEVGSEVLLEGVVIDGKASISIVIRENKSSGQENETQYYNETDFNTESSEGESSAYEKVSSDEHETSEREGKANVYESDHRSS